MSVTSFSLEPAGAWRFAVTTTPGDRDGGPLGNQSDGTPSTSIFFGATMASSPAERNVQYRSLLNKQGLFSADVACGQHQVGEGRRSSVESLIGTTKGWFTEDIMNIGVGFVWAGLLPLARIARDPGPDGRNLQEPQARGGGGESRGLMFSTYVWGKAQGLTDAASAAGDSPTVKRARTKKCSAKAREGSEPIETSKSAGRGKKGKKRPLTESASEECNEGPQLPDFSALENVNEESESLQKILRSEILYTLCLVRQTEGSTLANRESANLMFVSRSHGIDVLLMPAFVNTNHWVSIAVVGLSGVADILAQSNNSGEPTGTAGSERSQRGRFQIVLLDSFTTLTKTKSNPEKAKFHEHVKNVVLHMLASEWMWFKKCDDETSTAETFCTALAAKVAILSQYVQFSAPPVPAQKDSSQCGPMTILALQAFCYDEAFRNSCVRWDEGAVGENRNRSALDAYSFEDSFTLRCKMLTLVHEAISGARNEIAVCMGR